MHYIPFSGTSSPCNLLFLNLAVCGLVQAALHLVPNQMRYQINTVPTAAVALDKAVFSAVQDLYPQVNIFHFAWDIAPFMPPSALSPTQTPLKYKHGVVADEGPLPLVVPLQAAKRRRELPTYY